MPIFVGIISHEASPWIGASDFDNLLRATTELAARRQVLVEKKNAFNRKSAPVWASAARPFTVLWSLWDIRKFRRTPFLRRVHLCAREFLNELTHQLSPAASTRVLRNRNITEAHLRVWEAGLESSQDYVAVFEDDIAIHSKTFAQDINAAVRAAEAQRTTKEPFALFVSESFPLKAHDISPRTLDFVIEGGRRVMSHPEFDWCDSVAATIYSREFLMKLLDFLRTLPSAILWTIPVDWLVDLALKEHQKKRRLRTFHVFPGICSQRSITAQAKLRG